MVWDSRLGAWGVIMSKPDLTLVSQLRELDCCAVSDALDKLGLPGWVHGIKRLTTGLRIAGAVVTVRLESVNQETLASMAVPEKTQVRHLGTKAIELATPGDVIVVSHPGGIHAGTWGGTLSLGAHLKGIAGVVSNGLIRDVDEASELEFPIWGAGTTARTARGRLIETGTNVPIKLGEITVHAGDYIIADGSGVVLVAAIDIVRVLEVAKQIAGRESTMAARLRAGHAITQVMGSDYEHMLKKETD